MLTSLVLRRKAAQLLAADTATLAPVANAIVIALVKAAFIPAEDLLLVGVTVADFDGSNPLDVKLGAQPESLDPPTTDSVIDLVPDLGEFRWTTTGITNLPMDIFGYVLLNNAQTVVMASALLDTPIHLSAIDQRVDIGDPTISLRAGSLQ